MSGKSATLTKFVKLHARMLNLTGIATVTKGVELIELLPPHYHIINKIPNLLQWDISAHYDPITKMKP